MDDFREMSEPGPWYLVHNSDAGVVPVEDAILVVQNPADLPTIGAEYGTKGEALSAAHGEGFNVFSMENGKWKAHFPEDIEAFGAEGFDPQGGLGQYLPNMDFEGPPEPQPARSPDALVGVDPYISEGGQTIYASDPNVGPYNPPPQSTELPPPDPGPRMYADYTEGERIRDRQFYGSGDEMPGPIGPAAEGSNYRQPFLEQQARQEENEGQMQRGQEAMASLYGGEQGYIPPDQLTDNAELYRQEREAGMVDIFSEIYNDTPFEGYITQSQAPFANQWDPETAVSTILGAQGYGTAGEDYHGNRGYLEQMYDYAPIYQGMANPGGGWGGGADNFLDSSEFVMNLMGDNAEGVQTVNPQALYQNMFTDLGQSDLENYGAVYEDQYSSPAEAQYSAVMQSVAALDPWMGMHGSSNLEYMVTSMFQKYNAELGRSIDPSVSFVQYLRDNGADEWL